MFAQYLMRDIFSVFLAARNFPCIFKVNVHRNVQPKANHYKFAITRTIFVIIYFHIASIMHVSKLFIDFALIALPNVFFYISYLASTKLTHTINYLFRNDWDVLQDLSF